MLNFDFFIYRILNIKIHIYIFFKYIAILYIKIFTNTCTEVLILILNLINLCVLIKYNLIYSISFLLLNIVLSSNVYGIYIGF